jgi:hypothetical protein
MMRQIVGSFDQYEKTRLVTKLRGARERIRETQGKCEGRKSYAERDPVRRDQPATRLQREPGFDTIMQLNQKLGIPNEPSE